MALNGVRAAWFRVSANGKTGYVWSGILTTVAITESGKDPENVTFLTGISYVNEKGVTLQVRAVRKGKEIAKTEFPSNGNLDYELSITLKGSFFDKVKQVLSVELGYNACDYGQDDNLVFFTDGTSRDSREGGKLMQQLQVFRSYSSGEAYTSQTYILPSDKGGIAGHVLVTEHWEEEEEEEEVTKNGTPEYKIKDQKYKITLHKWTGTKLEKVFSR